MIFWPGYADFGAAPQSKPLPALRDEKAAELPSIGGSVSAFHEFIK
jgi:hypothetical protein